MAANDSSKIVCLLQTFKTSRADIYKGESQ